MNTPPAATPQSLADAFESVLTSVGGSVHRVRDEAHAADVLSELVASRGIRSLAHSGAPRAANLARSCADRVASPLECFEGAGAAQRERLLASDLGLTEVQWAIAETGTLVLESAAERHRLVSLVPPIHVALLDASRILPTLGAALAALRQGGPESLSHAVTFITGPSRTADIELTLVVGVHGPRELHVLLF